jgi:hypothetical protein
MSWAAPLLRSTQVEITQEQRGEEKHENFFSSREDFFFFADTMYNVKASEHHRTLYIVH